MRLLPNNIQRDILKRHIGPFVFSFFTIMFLLLMQFLMLHIDKLIGKGIPFLVIVELIATNLAYMVVLAAPMAVLVASVVAYGRFAENRELSALEAAGVNPIRVMVPALITAGLLCVFLIWFSNNVLPKANQQARALFIDIRTQKPGFDLESDAFYDGISGYTILVNRIHSETDSLYGVTLFQEPGSNRNRAVIKADKGVLNMRSAHNMLTLMFYDGFVLRHLANQEGKDMTEKTRFGQYRISFDISALSFNRTTSKEVERTDRTMNSQAMLAVVDSLRKQIEKEKQDFRKDIARIFPNPLKNALFADSTTLIDKSMARSYPTDANSGKLTALAIISDSTLQKQVLSRSQSTLQQLSSNYKNLKSNLSWQHQRINQYLVEVHKKFSIPFACIIFLLLGAPIGMLSRKGNLGFAALVSAGLLTFYWISIIQGEKLADRLYISPFTGMWFSNILLLLLGIILTLRLVTSFNLSKLRERFDV